MRYLLWSSFCCFLSGCVTVGSLRDEVVVFKSLLPADDPSLKQSVVLMGGDWQRLGFCNGVYLGKGQVLTAAHCIDPDLHYYVFAPVNIKDERPITQVTLRAFTVTALRRHPDYAFDRAAGKVRDDVAVIEFDSRGALVEAASLLPSSHEIPSPKSIDWKTGSQESFFDVDPRGQIELTGYKVERDKILKGVFLVRDTSHYIGEITPTNALLISLAPGTTIHPGVSGSGLFYRDRKGGRYLAGIASLHYPGINLLAAADVRAISKWLSKPISHPR